MKKFLLLTLCVGITAGCAMETKTVKDSVIEQVSAKETNQFPSEYVGNPQVPDDSSLDQVGEKFADRKGDLTLIKMLAPNETFEIGPMNLVIKDVKLMHLCPDYGMIDYFHVLTHEEEFDFVKVFYEVTNRSSEQVNFGPVALMETNHGEKVIWENDFYLDGLHGTYAAGEMKQGNVGFIVKNSDITSLKILTSDVFNKNEKLITKAQELKYTVE